MVWPDYGRPWLHSMKRYDSTRMVRVILTEHQRQWLESQATGMNTMSAVIRKILDSAMAQGPHA